MEKRGQVTIFVLLGFFVVAIIFILLFFRSEVFKGRIGVESGERFLDSQVEPLKSLVKDCAGQGLDVNVPGLISFAGYFSLTKYTYNYDGAYINKLITVEDGAVFNRAHLIGDIEQELNKLVLPYVVGCDFSSVEEEGIDLRLGEVSVNTTIFENTISVIVNYPIVLSKDGYSTVVENYLVTYPSNFGVLYNAALFAVQMEALDTPVGLVGYNNDPGNRVKINRDEDDFDEGVVYDIYIAGEEHMLFAVER